MAESWAKDSRGQSNHSGEASSAASAIGSIDSRDASNHARARARARARNAGRKGLRTLACGTLAFQESQSRSAAHSARHGKTRAESSANPRLGPARQKGINYLLTCRLLPQDFGSLRSGPYVDWTII
jgi:hypothetical protein